MMRREGRGRRRREGELRKQGLTVISGAVIAQWFKGEREIGLNFVQGSPVTSCLPVVWHKQLTRLHHHALLLTISKTHTKYRI